MLPSLNTQAWNPESMWSKAKQIADSHKLSSDFYTRVMEYIFMAWVHSHIHSDTERNILKIKRKNFVQLNIIKKISGSQEIFMTSCDFFLSVFPSPLTFSFFLIDPPNITQFNIKLQFSLSQIPRLLESYVYTWCFSSSTKFNKHKQVSLLKRSKSYRGILITM